MATYLYRLGRFVTRRRRLVVSVWLALLAAPERYRAPLIGTSRSISIAWLFSSVRE